MEKLKNDFLEVEYDERHNICIANWTKATENADANAFKDWNKELRKVVESCKPSGFLANTLKYKFMITTELQQWSVSNIFQAFAKAGVRKIAVIEPLDLFPKISTKQLTEEYKDGSIETVFFTDLEEAKAWLVSSN